MGPPGPWSADSEGLNLPPGVPLVAPRLRVEAVAIIFVNSSNSNNSNNNSKSNKCNDDSSNNTNDKSKSCNCDLGDATTAWLLDDASWSSRCSHCQPDSAYYP